MPHSIFGWSYPPGCSGPPEPDDDDTRCCRCHRDLDQAWEEYDDRPDFTDPTNEDDADPYEKSPMFDGFCCWACARDYYAQDVERKRAAATAHPDSVACQRAFEDASEAWGACSIKAKGATAPEPLDTTDPDWGGDYDPCDDPETPNA